MIITAQKIRCGVDVNILDTTRSSVSQLSHSFLLVFCWVHIFGALPPYKEHLFFSVEGPISPSHQVCAFKNGH